MSYDDNFKGNKQQINKKPHNLAMEDRKKLSVSGVEDVESFDEREIVMRTSLGTLVIEGEELSVSRLNVESGDVSVQGQITAMVYQETEAAGRSLWAKLFH